MSSPYHSYDAERFLSYMVLILLEYSGSKDPISDANEGLVAQEAYDRLARLSDRFLDLCEQWAIDEDDFIDRYWDPNKTDFIEELAADFVHSCNGAGCGFWETDDWTPAKGMILMEFCGSVGPFSLYTGDDPEDGYHLWLETED